MKITTNPKVETKFNDYPEAIREKLTNLRRIILETANEIDSINELEETLKWGEPSYLVKKGSTIRIDWKKKNPDQYAVYFKCTSKLVLTFKEVYGNIFQYENNRAILFKMDELISEKELKHCISLALTYHKVKHLPLLGT
jgi:hypothetical protein